jgi:hypothetical protein
VKRASLGAAFALAAAILASASPALRAGADPILPYPTSPPTLGPTLAPGTGETPLKIIGRTRTSLFCTTLRQNVAPTLLALGKNDDIVAAGHRAFAKMSDDFVHAGTGIAIDPLAHDRSYLDQLESALVHNVAVIDKLLADAKRFPSNPKSDDELAAAILKAQLETVEQHQKDVLNLISGTLETERLGQMQTELPEGLKAIVAQPSAVPTQLGSTAFSSAGLPRTADEPIEPRDLIDSSIAGKSIYGQVAGLIGVEQIRTQRDEKVLTTTVQSVVSDCK